VVGLEFGLFKECIMFIFMLRGGGKREEAVEVVGEVM